MAEQTIQLTKLASCAGCGAKVGAGVLAQLLGGLKVHSDPRLLVGFDKSDDASVYQVTDELALVQTVDFFPPIADDPYLFGRSPRRTHFRMSTPWRRAEAGAEPAVHPGIHAEGSRAPAAARRLRQGL